VNAYRDAGAAQLAVHFGAFDHYAERMAALKAQLG
jgi:hypothetical protein